MIPIDAYTFRREIDRFVDKYGHINMTITQFMTAVERSEMDAVPVIRCKDCKFNEWCGWLGQFRTEDDFCSHAERREEDERTDI